MIKKSIKKILNNLFQDHFDKKLILQAKFLSNINKKKKIVTNLEDIEFKVFSQWGEDGIIEWIISKINKLPEIFLEIGTEDYVESNTRFLLQNRNWDGYLIEANSEDVKKIKKKAFFWKHNLKISNSFINKENINTELKKMKIPKKIGLLSIDIDSIDYWVLKEINEIDPVIIICEFNPIFGKKKELTVKYKKKFIRNDEHYSNLFYGASIQAYVKLLKSRDYKFIGTNSAGNNAFFIKKNYSHKIFKALKEIKIFSSKFRESRNKKNKLNFLSIKDCFKEIGEKEVYDIKFKKFRKLKNIQI